MTLAEKVLQVLKSETEHETMVKQITELCKEVEKNVSRHFVVMSEDKTLDIPMFVCKKRSINFYTMYRRHELVYQA